MFHTEKKYYVCLDGGPSQGRVSAVIGNNRFLEISCWWLYSYTHSHYSNQRTTKRGENRTQTTIILVSYVSGRSRSETLIIYYYYYTTTSCSSLVVMALSHSLRCLVDTKLFKLLYFLLHLFHTLTATFQILDKPWSQV